MGICTMFGVDPDIGFNAEMFLWFINNCVTPLPTDHQLFCVLQHVLADAETQSTDELNIWDIFGLTSELTLAFGGPEGACDFVLGKFPPGPELHKASMRLNKLDVQ